MLLTRPWAHCAEGRQMAVRSVGRRRLNGVQPAAELAAGQTTSIPGWRDSLGRAPEQGQAGQARRLHGHLPHGARSACPLSCRFDQASATATAGGNPAQAQFAPSRTCVGSVLCTPSPTIPWLGRVVAAPCGGRTARPTLARPASGASTNSRPCRMTLMEMHHRRQGVHALCRCPTKQGRSSPGAIKAAEGVVVSAKRRAAV